MLIGAVSGLGSFHYRVQVGYFSQETFRAFLIAFQASTDGYLIFILAYSEKQAWPEPCRMWSHPSNLMCPEPGTGGSIYFVLSSLLHQAKK